MQLPLDKPAVAEQPLTRDGALLRLAVSDYIALTKPRIVLLLLVTTLVPMFLASEQPPSGWLVLWTMVGGFLAAGGANTLNQYIDRDIDHVMVRTRRRPLPGGRMTPLQVLIFGIVLSALSFVVLWCRGQPADGAAGAGGHPLLRLHLHQPAQAQQHAEHRDRRRGRGLPAAGGLGGRGQRDLAAAHLPVSDYLLLDAAPLLGAGPAAPARVPRRRACPCCRWWRASARRTARFCSTACFWRSSAWRPPFCNCWGRSTLSAAILLNAIFLKQAWDIWRTPTNQTIWRLYLFSLLFLALLFLAMGVDHLFYAAPAALPDIHLSLPI